MSFENKNGSFYRLPPEADTKAFLQRLDDLLTLFSEKVGIDKNTIYINIPMVIDIHTRIDQEKHRYEYFHSDLNNPITQSQARELAVLCYWIIKYKPLFQNPTATQEYYSKNFCTLNEMFVLFIIKSFALGSRDENEEEIIKYFSPENNYALIYNFMHKDMSKDSFILYVTSLLGKLEV